MVECVGPPGAPPAARLHCPVPAADRVPEGDGWIHELKHDGFRVLAFKDGDKVRLWSRNGRDWSAEFVAMRDAMRGSRSSASCWTGRP
jgi:ATP-dependent DNA ligase